jgi:hypothetical protein
MKFKINWGTGIGIFFACFVLYLIGNLIFSATQKVDLVTGDYYQQELAYQKQIDKETRTKQLPQQLKLIHGQATIALQFPDTMKGKAIGGEILFFRPSNSKLDVKMLVKVSESNLQVIDIRNFQKGLWRMKINWSCDGITYYNEETIMM